MTRSIHSTRTQYERERKSDYSDSEAGKSRIEGLSAELYKKRTLKERKRVSRKLEGIAFTTEALIDPSTVPMYVNDSDIYVHYPASIGDLLGVAARLPVNVMAGLRSITFCLGREYQDEAWEEEYPADRDPHKGRICNEEEGPFYIPPILGTYHSRSCRISLYAHVYDPAALTLKEVGPYLRFRMLITFVHEIAHHDDAMRRSGRGRWPLLCDWKCENYADLQMHEWVKEAVIPYLLEAYPREYQGLLHWIREKGGAAIPLEALAGDYRERPGGGLTPLIFSTIPWSVEDLFRNIMNGKPAREAMLEFAGDLHTGDYYGECLEALETLLAASPRDAEALGEKADTLCHLERYDDAESIARECLALDPASIYSLYALCTVYSARKDWEALREASSRGISASSADDWKHKHFLERNLVASLHLGNHATAREDAAALPEGRNRERKEALRALVLLCSGQVEEAIETAESLLGGEKIPCHAKALCKAVINGGRLRRDKGEPLLPCNEYEQDFIEGFGIIGLFGDRLLR